MPKPLTVDDVRAALEPHGITVQELAADTSTAPLAAQAIGCPVGAIVKSLLFFADEQPVLVLASGERRVDQELLARELGASTVRLAKPSEVIKVAGYAVGGVPPLGHREPLRTLLDRTLFTYDTVYAAAGAANAIFPVAPAHLAEISSATLTDASV